MHQDLLSKLICVSSVMKAMGNGSTYECRYMRESCIRIRKSDVLYEKTIIGLVAVTANR